jgi:heme exporter protein C
MHIYANPTRFLALAKWLMPLCFWNGLVLAAGAMAWGLFMVPPDRLMGETVRILFIHVPAAWLGMGGWAGIAISSAMLLIWKHPLAALAARAIALPGMVFCAICLATGSIWGRPTWGTWWEWDGRLTSMLVLLFLYAGYIALSQAASRDQKQAAAPQRTWSGMFPNVAAGIEALGSPWQRSRPADQQATEAPPQPTRR